MAAMLLLYMATQTIGRVFVSKTQSTVVSLAASQTEVKSVHNKLKHKNL